MSSRPLGSDYRTTTVLRPHWTTLDWRALSFWCSFLPSALDWKASMYCEKNLTRRGDGQEGTKKNATPHSTENWAKPDSPMTLCEIQILPLNQTHQGGCGGMMMERRKKTWSEQCECWWQRWDAINGNGWDMVDASKSSMRGETGAERRAVKNTANKAVRSQIFPNKFTYFVYIKSAAGEQKYSLSHQVTKMAIKTSQQTQTEGGSCSIQATLGDLWADFAILISAKHQRAQNKSTMWCERSKNSSLPLKLYALLDLCQTLGTIIK